MSIRKLARLAFKVIGLATLAGTTSHAAASLSPSQQSLQSRVVAVRETLDGSEAALTRPHSRVESDSETALTRPHSRVESDSETNSELAQWLNWPNWPNWSNWANWRNWGNF
jgi:hypothetical protein